MPGKLRRVRETFLRAVDEAEDFVDRGLTAVRGGSKTLAFTSSQRCWIAEHGLLKLTVAWDSFAETSLGCYAIGERAPSGYKARRLRIIRASVSEATRTFRGDKEFIDWISPSVVIKRAEAWLVDGEPFTTGLAGASQLLGYIKLMRNAIAHESEAATKKFKQRSRGIYGSLSGKLAPGIQLLSPCPAAFKPASPTTLLEHTVATYRALASTIVP
jgi:hypothetical protein